MYHILSLDGGGIRGVLTAALLERLQAHHPDFLGKVDLFAGTSTGGVLALGLAYGLSPAVCRRLYEKRGSQVFADTLADDLRDLGNAAGAEYSNANLRRALEDHFGDARLGDLPRRVLVAAFDLDNNPPDPRALRTWKPKFFHNFPGVGSDAAERVVDVALRTTAAPSYFPVYQGYIDGGVVANSPSVCALAQALEPGTGGQRLEDIALLSVGTGRCPQYLTAQDADWGWGQWARPLVSLVFGEGLHGVADYQCRQILGGRYHRLNPVLKDSVDLDDVARIPQLMEAARTADLSETLAWLGSRNGAGRKKGG